jgi:uncharacterized cupin superfamily protein
VTDPNVFASDWEVDFSETPVRMRAVRVGHAAGARELGASVYELEAGGVVSPYHRHHANEELLVVLEGSPELRTPEGTRRLPRGAVVTFLPGPDGAHQVRNPGPDTVRVLLISTMRFPEIAEHVSTGTTLAMTGPGEGKAFPDGGDRDFLELYQQAIARDAAGAAGSDDSAAGR